MPEKEVYALNTVSGVVSLVNRSFLDHPTYRDHLIEVESPDACISCGDQPDEVTTTDGYVIDLRDDELEDYDEESD